MAQAVPRMPVSLTWSASEGSWRVQLASKASPRILMREPTPGRRPQGPSREAQRLCARAEMPRKALGLAPGVCRSGWGQKPAPTPAEKAAKWPFTGPAAYRWAPALAAHRLLETWVPYPGSLNKLACGGAYPRSTCQRT